MMRNLIKQILREETSGLTDGQIKAVYSLMNMITKGYHWYHDTPEQPFEYTEGSIWLINPETKEWMIELEKSGHLWYYYKTYNTFSKYLNMEESDFESFIKIWVEDSLERGVVSTRWMRSRLTYRVEDALERGVVSTPSRWSESPVRVEDALKNGKQLK
jgi:hypothetical protein